MEHSWSAIAPRLVERFEPHRDAQRAAAMSAYMRNLFPFAGIAATDRRRLQREAAAGLTPPDQAALSETLDTLWSMPEREYQYAALDLASRHVRVCGPGFLATARRLVSTKSWWDTVDALAGHVVGPLVAAHPQLTADMDEWIQADDMWVARTALLHQLTYKQRTDRARLFAYCLARSGHPDFFIRKAIGWSLREYSKTDAEAVRAFVTDNDDRLSPLSKREALLWLTSAGLVVGGRNSRD
jgi:3-methyladenine DNA glycosylase AlkD